jgi:predicted acetyltransferase
MSDLEIVEALSSQAHIIQNLMQLYVHDFSEQWSGMERGELGGDGLFPEYPYLDSYWREGNRIPLLVRHDGNLAGFALINDHSHSGLPVDRNMAEFFIVRKHRRGGVGTNVAHTIFSRYPGQWEAAVAKRNVGALAFWRSAVRLHPAARDIQETNVETVEWNGPILRFRIAEPL